MPKETAISDMSATQHAFIRHLSGCRDRDDFTRAVLQYDEARTEQIKLLESHLADAMSWSATPMLMVDRESYAAKLLAWNPTPRS